MKKTSIILVSLVLLSTLMFFGVRYFWKNRHEYFFKGTQPFELREQQKQGNSWWDKQETTAEAGNEEKVEKTIERPVKEYETPKIESEDCDNKCDDYDEKEERIVFDHLVPSRKDLTGLYEYYIPEGTFNSYNYKKGKWWLEQDVDIRNQTKVKKYKKPKRGLTPN